MWYNFWRLLKMMNYQTIKGSVLFGTGSILLSTQSKYGREGI